MLKVHTTYLGLVIDPGLRGIVINKLADTIEGFYGKFSDDIEENEDYLLVGTGMSGMLVLMELAERLNLPFAFMRKEDSSHSFRTFEGTYHRSGEHPKHIIFVDDFVDSGQTVAKVISNLIIENILDLEDTTFKVFVYEHSFCGGKVNITSEIKNEIKDSLLLKTATKEFKEKFAKSLKPFNTVEVFSIHNDVFERDSLVLNEGTYFSETYGGHDL